MADDALPSGESGASANGGASAVPPKRARHALPKEMQSRRSWWRRSKGVVVPPPTAEPVAAEEATEPDAEVADPAVAEVPEPAHLQVDEPEAVDAEAAVAADDIDEADVADTDADEAAGAADSEPEESQPEAAEPESDEVAEPEGDAAESDQLAEPEGDPAESDAAESDEPGPPALEVPALRRPRRMSPIGTAIAAGIVIVLVLGALAGYLGWQAYQVRLQDQQRELFLDAGRQAAVALTSLRYDSGDAGVAQLLELSTDKFHEDLTRRRDTFLEVLKQAQGVSTGEVTSAGLESFDGDRAQVLVAVNVLATVQATPEEQRRNWRMRLLLRETAPGEVKVSRVEYIS
ncbi:prolipoprotein diacylglyceryl transferase [Mycolicibacterium fallax]|uniref:Uncharacterized protein n=1 Tax=Mycolicibacterium fallax TaxID=1793 RepID=A0A1X1QXH3_MYCFA|nr:hypothetical protein [Mycolicibacterium fallax]ORU96092.1 hypothetical protein AWC04_00425 [Mycolicibacterium fallax]BBZ00342.1 hypothetical protein MFAL_38080 [Mycolicibacterium fallax]